MQIGRIEGCTRVLGKSQGYLGLPLRDITINDSVNGPDTPAMETAWFPTPAELEAISAGAPVSAGARHRPSAGHAHRQADGGEVMASPILDA